MSCGCKERRQAIISGSEKMNNVFSDFSNWLARPYSPDMTVGHWFGFVGLIIIFMALWGTIIRKVID